MVIDPTVPAAPTAALPSAASSTARLSGAFGGLRRAGGSASASAGPMRHALRRLPEIWALDRTLIASLATLLLAIVALAFATDAVGLGAAAGFSAAGSPTP